MYVSLRTHSNTSTATCSCHTAIDTSLIAAYLTFHESAKGPSSQGGYINSAVSVCLLCLLMHFSVKVL